MRRSPQRDLTDQFGSPSSSDSSNTSLDTPRASTLPTSFVPEEDEEYDDALESEEDDIGYGDTRRLENGEDKGSAQQIVIDMPQKNKDYMESKSKMEKKKKKLIEGNHIIEVKVKPKRAYDVGGRIQGKKNGKFKGRRGTIVRVIKERTRFEIEW